MKTKIVEAYASAQMPRSCEEKIREKAKERLSVRSQIRRISTVAASFAAILVLLFAISPAARAVVSGWKVKYFWPGSDLTIYEVRDGDVEATVAVVDTDAPAFARMVDGRLYFLGNGEKIDITDEIREDSPYFYTYVDEYGLTHDMAVGYSGSLENYGIYEFIWKEEAGEKNWTAGTGRNFLDNQTETRYPWVDIVWEELNVPWPKPDE